MRISDWSSDVCSSDLKGRAQLATSLITSPPRQRKRLHVGVALHRLDDAFLVAEAGVLDAAEGRHLDAVAGHFPDVHGADPEAEDVEIGSTSGREIVCQSVWSAVVGVS